MQQLEDGSNNHAGDDADHDGDPIRIRPADHCRRCGNDQPGDQRDRPEAPGGPPQSRHASQHKDRNDHRHHGKGFVVLTDHANDPLGDAARRQLDDSLPERQDRRFAQTEQGRESLAHGNGGGRTEHADGEVLSSCHKSIIARTSRACLTYGMIDL